MITSIGNNGRHRVSKTIVRPNLIEKLGGKKLELRMLRIIMIRIFLILLVQKRGIA